MSPSLQYVQSTQGLLNLGLPRRLARGLCLGRADHVDVADDALPHGLERLEKFRGELLQLGGVGEGQLLELLASRGGELQDFADLLLGLRKLL
eukprot:CAMPEP_0173279134 /NCGR_PEP_ID=MMETSP1143-20121109/4984_1 /TAXON_ID=483371 /ORGANISM="non described non described, Strain CCMP2298" /LENGTH=92 /DNA_ID=CAMNT_0014216337 /DNA_START=341 /DNA_END=616 /DNA_ORIENTATION=+